MIRISKLGKRATIAALLSAVSIGVFGFATPAAAAWPSNWHCEIGKWPDSNLGSYVYSAKCEVKSDPARKFVSALWHTRDNKLEINDYYANGRETYVYLYNSDRGTGYHRYSPEHGEYFYGLADQGDKLHFQVCSSNAGNAACSPYNWVTYA